MSRRQNNRAVRNVDGERSSIGDSTVAIACSQIDHCARAEAALVVSRRFSLNDAITAMFPPDVIARAAAARGIVYPVSMWGSYTVMPGVTVTLKYSDGSPLPIIASNFSPQEAFTELANIISELRAIREKYGRVKHMLRWFNRGATAGAIRDYWPAALQLCPKAPAFNGMHEAAPTRYATPSNIGSVLPLIRETASTVCAMALLPKDACGHVDSPVTLGFAASNTTWDGVSINYDTSIFVL